MAALETNPVGNLTAYELRHLGEHLATTGRADNLHHLLGLETSSGWNAWYQAKDAHGDAVGYVSDVLLAWRLAEDEFVLHDSLPGLTLQCRYAFIYSSLNSLAENLPPSLLSALVDKGVWPLSQGLFYARRIPEPLKKVTALLRLMPHMVLGSEQFTETVWAILEILENDPLAFSRARVNLLARKMPHRVPGTRLDAQALWRILCAIERIPAPSIRVEIMAELLPPVMQESETGEQTLQEVLRSLGAVPVSVRTEILTGLTTWFIKSGMPFQFLLDAPEVTDTACRAAVLTQAIPLLSLREKEKALVEAFEMILANPIALRYDNWLRQDRLVELVQHVSDSLVPEILALPHSISKDCKATLFAELAPRLSEEQVREAMTIVAELPFDLDHSRFLPRLLPRLAELGYPEEALQSAWNVPGAEERARVLVDMLPYLKGPMRDQVWEEALSLAIDSRAYETQFKLIPFAPESVSPRLVASALAAIQEDLRKPHSSREEMDKQALLALFKYLAEAGYGQAVFTIFRHLAHAWHQADQPADDQLCILPDLVQEMAKTGCILEALSAVWEIRDELWFTKSLTRVAPYLSETWLRKALPVVQEISRARNVDAPLGILLTRLAELGHPEEAFNLAEGLSSARAASALMEQLAPHLTAQQLLQAVATVRKVQDPKKLAHRALLFQLPGRLLKLGYVDSAVRVLGFIDDEKWRAAAVLKLARALAEQGSVEEGLVLIENMVVDEETQEEVLVELVPYLNEYLLTKVLKLAGKVQVAEKRTQLLASLAPSLAEMGYHQDALTIVRAIRDEQDAWSEALTAMEPHLPEQLKSEGVLRHELHAAQKHQYEKQYEALIATFEERIRHGHSSKFEELLPTLSETLQRDALDMVATVAAITDRAALLVELMPYLTLLNVGEALRMAPDLVMFDINWPWEMLRVMVASIPRLAELGYVELALEILEGIEPEGWRRGAIIDLSPYLAEPLRSTIMNGVIEAELKIPEDKYRARALVKLAPHLTPQQTEKALAAAREIGDQGHREEALAALVIPLAELVSHHEALAVAREIVDTRLRAQAFTQLALSLPEPLKSTAILEAFSVVLRLSCPPGHTLTSPKVAALQNLAPILAGLPRSTLAQFWLAKDSGTSLLHILADGLRSELIVDLIALGPVIVELGGPEAIEETLRAYQDVERWWS